MIVIADTTPLNYLILIELTQILSALFGQVVIPQTVLKELQAPQAPDKVREWLAHRPEWLIIKEVQQQDVTLAHLDPGEREAITLAQELRADLVLLDERLGRQEATGRRFNKDILTNCDIYNSFPDLCVGIAAGFQSALFTCVISNISA